MTPSGGGGDICSSILGGTWRVWSQVWPWQYDCHEQRPEGGSHPAKATFFTLSERQKQTWSVLCKTHKERDMSIQLLFFPNVWSNNECHHLEGFFGRWNLSSCARPVVTEPDHWMWVLFSIIIGDGMIHASIPPGRWQHRPANVRAGTHRTLGSHQCGDNQRPRHGAVLVQSCHSPGWLPPPWQLHGAGTLPGRLHHPTHR